MSVHVQDRDHFWKWAFEIIFWSENSMRKQIVFLKTILLGHLETYHVKMIPLRKKTKQSWQKLLHLLWTTVVEISQTDNETISTECDIVISETQIPSCSKTTESSTIGTQSILENLSKTNPVRPIKNSYPQRLLGGQLRSFQASWYEKRE